MATNCSRLKFQATDGKMRLTDAARKQLEDTTGKKVISPLNAKELGTKLENNEKKLGE